MKNAPLALLALVVACSGGATTGNQPSEPLNTGDGPTTERPDDSPNPGDTTTEPQPIATPVECGDADGDGFDACPDPNDPSRPVDCNDSNWVVQPGGYEYRGNGIDDNCDGRTDEITFCDCQPGKTQNADLLAQAIGVCDETYDSGTADSRDEQIAVFGNFFGVQSREGGCMVVMSTGNVSSTRIDSVPSNYNGPSPSRCRHDDPDSNSDGDQEICDLAEFRMTLNPPTNARGFEFGFMFVSSEWPEFLCKNFNDTFYATLNSEKNANVPTNVSFDGNGNEITVNVGFFEDPALWSTDLSTTPFGDSTDNLRCGASQLPDAPGCNLPTYCDGGTRFDEKGSGSGWLITRAPIQQGEDEIELVFTVHDEGDEYLDSVVLIDSFRWLPTEPEPSTGKDVGIAPQ